jgi:hypothetical protein
MKVIELSAREARSWTERWLGAGHFVSEAVLAKAPFDQGRFRTCIGDDTPLKKLANFEHGWVIKGGEAGAWLSQVLDELALHGASCVIVEDDLSRPTDPAIIASEIPCALIEDRILCWSDLSPGNGATAVKRTGYIGSGYPRNAFVVSRSAAELGLADRQQVPETFLRQVTDSLMAVIVAIFDAESYLVWTPPAELGKIVECRVHPSAEDDEPTRP